MKQKNKINFLKPYSKSGISLYSYAVRMQTRKEKKKSKFTWKGKLINIPRKYGN